MLCCSGLPSTLIYPRRGRGGQRESDGRGQTPPRVNSKTLLMIIASNSRTPFRHIVHHAVSKQIPLVADGSGHEDLVYHTRASRGRVEGGIRGYMTPMSSSRLVSHPDRQSSQKSMTQCPGIFPKQCPGITKQCPGITNNQCLRK